MSVISHVSSRKSFFCIYLLQLSTNLATKFYKKNRAFALCIFAWHALQLSFCWQPAKLRPVTTDEKWCDYAALWSESKYFTICSRCAILCDRRTARTIRAPTIDDAEAKPRYSTKKPPPKVPTKALQKLQSVFSGVTIIDAMHMFTDVVVVPKGFSCW